MFYAAQKVDGAVWSTEWFDTVILNGRGLLDEQAA
jgi:hypothetical protein